MSESFYKNSDISFPLALDYNQMYYFMKEIIQLI